MIGHGNYGVYFSGEPDLDCADEWVKGDTLEGKSQEALILGILASG